jgi:hypothetical protein
VGARFSGYRVHGFGQKPGNHGVRTLLSHPININKFGPVRPVAGQESQFTVNRIYLSGRQVCDDISEDGLLLGATLSSVASGVAVDTDVHHLPVVSPCLIPGVQYFRRRDDGLGGPLQFHQRRLLVQSGQHEAG